MDIRKFHEYLNPKNEKLYIPVGQVTGREENIELTKKAFKKPQTAWQKDEGRYDANGLVEYINRNKITNTPTLIGYCIPDDLIVVDVDLMVTAEFLTKILDDMSIRHCRLRTNAGKHFIFKRPEHLVNKKRLIGVATPIGMLIDQLTPNVSFILLPFVPSIPAMEKYHGLYHERKVEKLEPRDKLDIIPEWLIADASLGKGGGKTQEEKRRAQEKILPMPLVSGIKTDNLQRWLHNLAHSGYKMPFVESTIRLINKYLCIPSIPTNTLDSEILNKRNLKTALDNVKSAEEIQAESLAYIEGNKFKHYQFAQFMLDKYNIISIEGRLGLYNEGVYELNEDLVRQKMLIEIPILKRSQVEESIYNLQKMYYSYHDEGEFPFEVVVQNGILDVRTGQLFKFNPDRINLNKLKTSYVDYGNLINLPANEKPLEMQLIEKFLMDITLDDPELVMLILQMCGYALWRVSPLKKSFILFGRGDNGKSILLHVLEKVIGLHNFAALEFNDFTNDSFKVVNLKHKLACITNDISKQTIKETNVFKAVVAGDPIEAGAKGIQAKTFKPFATIIMSANNIPKTTDTSKGFFERIIILPFDRDFVAEGIADPGLAGKLTTPKALEYFLYLMVQASKTLFNQGKFSFCDRSHRANQAYRMDHNSTLRWLLGENISMDSLAKRKRSDTYDEYCAYCAKERVPPIGKVRFYSSVTEFYPKLVKQRTSEKDIWKIVGTKNKK